MACTIRQCLKTLYEPYLVISLNIFTKPQIVLSKPYAKYEGSERTAHRDSVGQPSKLCTSTTVDILSIR